MKLKVQHIMDSVVLISQIIREQRPMPQKGKYRLARMHSKLMPEFTVADNRRNDMIKAYNFHPIVPGPITAEDPMGQKMVESPDFAVPEDKIEEFQKAWEEIADQTIDVDVEPMPLAQFDLGDKFDGSLQGNDIIVLGSLITE